MAQGELPDRAHQRVDDGPGIQRHRSPASSRGRATSMIVTVQVTLDGRVLLMSGRKIIELERTDDTRHIIELLQEAVEVQTQVNGEPHDTDYSTDERASSDS